MNLNLLRWLVNVFRFDVVGNGYRGLWADYSS